jgi:hypothetical protein
LTEKIELLEERVRETKRAVKQKFDYRYQTEQQPWKMLGVSVGAGFLLGKLIKGRSAPRRVAVQPAQTPAAAQVAQKSTLRGALIGAVVPMLVEFGKNAALRAVWSRGGGRVETRERNEARVLTPFRDEPPHHHPTAVPSKPIIEK